MEEFQLYAVCLTLLALFFAWYLKSGGNKKLPPSPPALPIIGNLHQIGALAHRSLWNLSRKYGPLMLVHFGSKPMLVVSSADVAKEIYKTHDLSFASRHAYKDVKKYFYDMKDLIYLPYSEEWRKLRSIFVHELMSSKRVKSYNSIMEEEIALLVEKIKDCSFSARPVNLTKMFASLANDLISRAAFGKKNREMSYGKEIVDVTDDVVGTLRLTVGEFIPWLGWISRWNGHDAAMDSLIQKRDKFMEAILEDHLNKSPNTSTGDGVNENFVDILLGIYKGNTPGVSIDLISIKALLLDAVGAGTDTSSKTLTWAVTEMIRHPAVMKKLQDEIRATMKGKQHITDDDLQKMHYLKAVIKETLRLHPPITLNFRSARENVNLMGYDIAPNTNILINAWGIGRDPGYWDEPEKFMPERFLNSSVDLRGFDFQLTPFGGGRRICPGLGFAATTIELTLANLMHKFEWELPDGAKGEDLDVIERPGFAIGKKNPLVVVASLSSNA